VYAALTRLLGHRHRACEPCRLGAPASPPSSSLSPSLLFLPSPCHSSHSSQCFNDPPRCIAQVESTIKRRHDSHPKGYTMTVPLAHVTRPTLRIAPALQSKCPLLASSFSTASSHGISLPFLGFPSLPSPLPFPQALSGDRLVVAITAARAPLARLALRGVKFTESLTPLGNGVCRPRPSPSFPDLFGGSATEEHAHHGYTHEPRPPSPRSKPSGGRFAHSLDKHDKE